MPQSHHLPPEDGIARDIGAAFGAWNQDHKDSLPSTGGRRLIDSQNVIARARNLLPILDIFAEAHPITKVVVNSFKVVIIFEAERRENNARVATVIFAQTEMMSAFLEVYSLSDTQHSNSNIRPSLAHRFRQDLLDKVRFDIEACGNVIDTYYKEPRLVKFLKALDWKDILLGYIQTFNTHRGEIQLMLTLRTAVMIDGLTSKVDTILGYFTQQEEWEKKLKTRIANLADNKIPWIEDDETLQQLVSITDDPLLHSSSLTPNNPKGIDNMVVLKDAIQSPLNELFRRNSDIFYRKLDLQTRQMENAIASSAAYIVQELSGPYDRLWNENFRQLWKEMSWAFCVDTQQFAQALCEYFFDLFSPPARGTKTALMLPSSDAWTLQYLSTYARQISNVIDSDRSGFIRISEANAFASRIPDGWSLPQWCCYAAVGLPYERSIYRNRIHDVMDRMLLEQTRVKPSNRAHYARFINGEGIAALSLLARGRFAKLDPSAPWQALADAKVNQQDKRLREDLLALKFNIDAAETIHILCGETPVEDYILQLATLLLEHYFQVTQLCNFETLDTLEFRTMWESLEIVREELDRRIEELKSGFANQMPNKDDGVNALLDDYSDSIFRVYHRYAILASRLDGPETIPNWDMEEITSRLAAITSNRDSPLEQSPSPTMIKGCLIFKTWEDHIQSLPMNTINSAPIPLSWNLGTQPPTVTASDTRYFGGAMERILDFPIHEETWCDECHQRPIVKQVCFTCVVCANTDLCASCYLLPSTELNLTCHSDTHEMIKHTLFITTTHRGWFVGLARYFLTEFYSLERLDPTSTPLNEARSKIFAPIPPCHHCKEIKRGSVFQCMEVGCGCFLCSDCEKITSGDPCSPPEPEVTSSSLDSNAQHQPWHTVLIIHPNVNSGGSWSSRLFEKPSPRPQEVVEVKPNSNTLDGRVAAVEDRMEAMENRMANIEVTLGEVKTLLTQFLTQSGPRR